MEKGVRSEKAFALMERVRKGRAFTPEVYESLIENGMEEWKVKLLSKVRYLTRRNWAEVYARLSFHLAYYKLHYPEIFYKTYYEMYVTEDMEQAYREMKSL